MSDHYLRIIPADPRHVPPPDAQLRAEASLRLLAPAADDVHSEISEEVRFIDAGENTETIACPRCRSAIEDSWWQDAMNRAAAHSFQALAVTLPCCGTSSTLNDLVYRWPAGFARYVLEAMNPGLAGFLDPEQLTRLHTDLGCELKQIIAHY